MTQDHTQTTHQPAIAKEEINYTRTPRSINKRLEAIFHALESQDDWINLSDLSKKTGLSTTVLRDWFSRIHFIQQQYPILLDTTSDYETRVKLGSWRDKTDFREGNK